MKIITLFLVLAITGCETANVAFNEKYDGDDFMLNYEYGDGNIREDLLSKYYIIKWEDGEQIKVVDQAYNKLVYCEFDRVRYYNEEGNQCTILK